MPMPTTRRGRFEYYRARAMRRKKFMRDRSRYSGGASDNRELSRVPVNEFGKQVLPDVYHRPKRGPRGNNFWSLPGHIRPDHGQWGVIQIENFVPWWWRPTHHPERAFTNYYFRRVKSTPRLKHWRYHPYTTPPPPNGSTAYYPFEFYPSGLYNPRWWFMRDPWWWLE